MKFTHIYIYVYIKVIFKCFWIPAIFYAYIHKYIYTYTYIMYGRFEKEPIVRATDELHIPTSEK